MAEKYVTFGFDDGVTQDRRLIRLLNKYGLKATFFLNSALLGLKGSLQIDGQRIDHTKVLPSEVRTLYDGHEVAVHTLTHPNLPDEVAETVAYQTEADRENLQRLVGYPVRGMAYPFGGANEQTEEVVRCQTGVRYVRTTDSSHGFGLPNNLYRLAPSVHIFETDEMFALAEKFLASQTDEPQIFYVWGHAYELDIANRTTWETFERFCRLIGGKKDVHYVTNYEALCGACCLANEGNEG